MVSEIPNKYLYFFCSFCHFYFHFCFHILRKKRIKYWKRFVNFDVCNPLIVETHLHFLHLISSRNYRLTSEIRWKENEKPVESKLFFSFSFSFHAMKWHEDDNLMWVFEPAEKTMSNTSMRSCSVCAGICVNKSADVCVQWIFFILFSVHQQQQQLKTQRLNQPRAARRIEHFRICRSSFFVFIFIFFSSFLFPFIC